MYRPLYMFGNNGNSVSVNYPLSLANQPVYSADGKTVTISMKGWKWSNGETVNADDVVFWLNMMEAEKANYYGYTPGLLPDNLTSYSATGPDTVVLHLKSAVSSIWFTYNQLAEITPMPMAWDVSAASATAGSGGCTTDSAKDKWAKCDAVFNFLTAQAKNVKTYATNPVWAVVDGPWKLTAFSTASAGPVTSFVAERGLLGRPQVPARHAHVLRVHRRHDRVHGAEDRPDRRRATSRRPTCRRTRAAPSCRPLTRSAARTTSSPAYQYGIYYMVINFNNPTIGPAFKQLYVRQALQDVVDQPGIDKAVYRGYAYPTSGGVPTQPKSQWVPSVQNANGGQGPYAFSISTATSLLTSHGWKEVGGVMTCESAGTASNECGAGVTAGTKLSLTMDYATGVQAFQEEVAVYKSDATQAGHPDQPGAAVVQHDHRRDHPVLAGTEVHVGHPQLRWLELQRPRLRADR